MKIIGISGGSGAGKTTSAKILNELLPNSLLINGDIFMHEESKILEKDILNYIGIEKEKDVFSYNYYFESFENVKKWIKIIEPNMIKNIEDRIERIDKDKEYVIVDWVFLPLCDWYQKCDYKVVIVNEYDKKLKRLTKRLQDKTVYNEGDRSYWSYKPGIIEKRLKFTTLNELGYNEGYKISNAEGIESLYKNINMYIDNILGENEEIVKNKLAHI